MIAAPVHRPIGRQVREVAATICAIQACGCSNGVLESLGIEWGAQAHRLADAALSVAWRSHNYWLANAEAEAMLRTGWEP